MCKLLNDDQKEGVRLGFDKNPSKFQQASAGLKKTLKINMAT